MSQVVSQNHAPARLAPASFDAHVLTGMLAPDGRCKTLDASADGYVRAENCIVMVLQKVDGADSTACGLLAASAVGQVLSQRMLDA
jgi:Beta-ketoacyl synthase, N-terminal domain